MAAKAMNLFICFRLAIQLGGFTTFDLEVVEIAGDVCVGENSLGFGEHVLFAVAAGDMRENELADFGVAGQFGGLLRGEVGEIFSHFTLFFQVSGLDDQGVYIAGVLEKIVSATRIADVHKARTWLGWSKDFFGLDHLAIFQADRFALG